MKILALDLDSYRTGFACGVAGSLPRVQTWLLRRRGEPVEMAVRNLGCTLRDNIQFEAPDLIAVEDYLNPVAQPSADAAIAALLLHGGVELLAGTYGIPVKRTHVDTIRRVFCGRSSFFPRTRGPKTSRQKAEARAATKAMVLRRAIDEGMLPHGCLDDDKGDACAVFRHAEIHFAKVAPKALIMFSEIPA
jgi:hypothetical protein